MQLENIEELIKEDTFYKTHGKKYTDKVKYLSKVLIEGETGSGKYKVIPFEAGIGKSRKTDMIISEYLNNLGNRKFLIVKRFNNEAIATANHINSNSILGDSIALAITSENWKILKQNPKVLLKYTVLIISHSRYVRLAGEDIHDRQFFTKDRHTMVIDEALHMPIYSFTEKKYLEILNLLPFSLHPLFVKACEGLFHYLTINKSLLKAKKRSHEIMVFKPKLDKGELAEFKIKFLEKEGILETQKREDVKDFVRGLELFYANTCIFNNNRISTYDRGLTRWGLANNIILDANGMLDKRYEYDPKIEVNRQTKIIDHSTTNFTQIIFNTSTYNIKKTNGKYNKKIAELISSSQKDEDKTLIVTNLKLKDKLERELSEYDILGKVEVSYFGNIVGKNEWREFNKVWILATPHLPMEHYTIMWSMATGQEFHNRFRMDYYAKKGKMAFVKSEFEEIRQGYLAGEIYQAIKRINRDNSHEAAVFVINSDGDVIERVINELKGVKVNSPVELEVESESISRPAKTSKTEELVRYLLSLSQGEYPKKEISSKVDIDKSNFSKYLKSDEVKSLIKEGLIEIKQKSIKRLYPDY
ncbi:hypothetical protein JOC75_001980 [Metabacillus crassostreae]|uniref:hypothetical protein n=1 Tax=Metabacillus crassostreae TaxID=929098 RepID=UPI001958F659|nr:hypothetical protein [Metabacillus crassostreae]MBM7604007.1 hypothetical protein [Metabacillus crassostreae]